MDKSKKLVKVAVSGFTDSKEITDLISEFEKTAKQMKAQEGFLLVDMRGFKPASAEILPKMQSIQIFGAEHFKKMASIHESVIAQMQLKRIGEETQANNNISRFKSEEEALKYLFE